MNQNLQLRQLHNCINEYSRNDTMPLQEKLLHIHYTNELIKRYEGIYFQEQRTGESRVDQQPESNG